MTAGRARAPVRAAIGEAPARDRLIGSPRRRDWWLIPYQLASERRGVLNPSSIAPGIRAAAGAPHLSSGARQRPRATT
jgi:hypothetical protein